MGPMVLSDEVCPREALRPRVRVASIMLLAGLLVLAATACSRGPETRTPEPPDATATIAGLQATTAAPGTDVPPASPVVAATAAVSGIGAADAVTTDVAPLVAVPAEVEPTVNAPVSNTPEVTTYVVEPGDTLLGIAMAFDVPMAAVQLENQMGSGTIVRLGEVLQIPASESWVDASPFWVVYEIASGETLGAVAARFGVGVDTLTTINGLADPNKLFVGQALVLPLNLPIEAVSPEPGVAAAAAAPVAVPAAEEDAPEASVAVAADAEPVVAAEAPSVEPEPAAPAAPVAPPPDVAALPAEILRLLNEQRAAYGLPALAWNGILAQAAQRHADDCYARGYCGHTGSDGSTYRERIIREGYDPVRWSECWAWYGSAEQAVAMWMDEVPPNDPHRRTILSTYLTEVGVGVVPGNGRGYYFIADFGTPR